MYTLLVTSGLWSFHLFLALYGKTSDGLWLQICHWNLKNVSDLCLSPTAQKKKKKLGEVDRGRRPRGPLSEPGADEEQPVGGEREVHPPLEENQPTTCHDFARPTRKHARAHTDTHLHTNAHTYTYTYTYHLESTQIL